MEVPSTAYTQVVPDCRFIENTCDPVLTLADPPASTVLLPSPHTWKNAIGVEPLQVLYPTCPQTSFERSSATQNARHPVTGTLTTWIVPLTPVLGRAEESVESAPTHQTELPVVAENSPLGVS